MWARRRYSSVASEIPQWRIFPLADQVGHRARLLLGLHLRVDAVLIVEIDAVGAQAAERLLAVSKKS